MDKLLQIVEPTTQPDEVEMDPEKLTFLNSKLKVWDFAKTSSSETQSLSCDDKSNILIEYYVEMLAKGKLFSCCCLAVFWLCFD